MFEMIKKQISANGLNSTFHTNLFITGGGSNLFNLEKYCSNFFGSSVKKLHSNNKNEEEKIFSDSFASCLGAIKIIVNGWETEAIPEPTNQNAGKIGFLSKIFRNFS